MTRAAPGLCSPLPHPHRDRAHPADICARSGAHPLALRHALLQLAGVSGVLTIRNAHDRGVLTTITAAWRMARIAVAYTDRARATAAFRSSRTARATAPASCRPLPRWLRRSLPRFWFYRWRRLRRRTLRRTRGQTTRFWLRSRSVTSGEMEPPCVAYLLRKLFLFAPHHCALDPSGPFHRILQPCERTGGPLVRA